MIGTVRGVNTDLRQMGGAVQQTDAYTKSIQKQIAKLQERIQEISSNDEMELEEKMKRRQELQQEIANLMSQLRQHQIEQRKESRQGGVSAEALSGGGRKTGAKEGKRRGPGMSQEGMEAMISAGASVKQAKAQGGVVSRMEGNVRVLSSEILQDQRLGKDTRTKEEELAKMEERTADAFVRQAGLFGEASASLEKASGDGQEKDTEEKAEDLLQPGNGRTPRNEEGNKVPDGRGTQVDVLI